MNDADRIESIRQFLDDLCRYYSQRAIDPELAAAKVREIHETLDSCDVERAMILANELYLRIPTDQLTGDFKKLFGASTCEMN